jgi:heme ABC exporter ATP-binding subunit CcmA/heme exporter protein CcmB
MAPALQAVGLTRRYGTALALRDVNLMLDYGERVALLGPNGAGKTTLLRVLAGALRPTRGIVQVGGADLGRTVSARRAIGVVGHQTCLTGELTIRENLRFFGRLYGVGGLEHRIAAVLDEVELSALADRPVRTLSRGMQQRAALARALLHDPPILLLDEPETALDQPSQERLAALLRAWSAQGRAVLFASHRLEWAEALADRALVLRAGRIADEITGLRPLLLGTRYRQLMEQAGGEPERPRGPGSHAERRTSRHERGGAMETADPALKPDLVAPPREPGAAVASAARGGALPVGMARQLAAVIAKDVLLEWRTKDALAAMLVFVLLTLVTFNFALDLRPEVMAAVGPGVLWIAVVFGSMLGPGRSFIREQESGTMEALLMAPLDRSTLFLGKLAVNLLVMVGVQAVCVPVFLALFAVSGAVGPLASVLVAGTVGLGAVETLLAAIAAHTRAREVMLPVLVLPIVVPIVIGVVQATGLAMGSPVAQDLPWLRLILAFDALYLAAGIAVFEYVLEE